MSITRLRIAEPGRLLRRRKVTDGEGNEVARIEGPWHDSLRLIVFIIVVFATHSLGKVKLILPILLLLGIYLWLRPRGLSVRHGRGRRWFIRTGWWIRDGSRWWIHSPSGERWLWTPGRRTIERSMQTTHQLVSVSDDEWRLKENGSARIIEIKRLDEGGFEVAWSHEGDPARTLAFAAAPLAKLR